MINITKDIENKKLHIVRTFNAQKDKVWEAWTDSTILDQWWAPKPWTVETKMMDFKAGGQWLYTMVDPAGKRMEAPDGTTVWSKVAYIAINPPYSFSTTSTFCDEHGKATSFFPGASYWTVEMEELNGVTTVNVTVAFNELVAFEKLVAMGFEGGFTMGLAQLEHLMTN